MEDPSEREPIFTVCPKGFAFSGYHVSPSLRHGLLLKCIFLYSKAQGDGIHGRPFHIPSKCCKPGSPLTLQGQVLYQAFLFKKFQKEVVLVSTFIYISELQGRHGRPFQELSHQRFLHYGLVDSMC